MIEKYIAPFVTPRSAEVFANKELDNPEVYGEFLKGCCEFAHAFNLHVAPSTTAPQGRKAGMFSKSGLYVGALSYSKDYSCSNRDFYFIFESPLLIGKQRSSRSGRNARDSGKITNLIRALIKAGEKPEEDKLIRMARNAARYAFGCILNHDAYTKPRVDIDHSVVVALVEHYLNTNPLSVEQYETVIQEKYDDYLKSLAKSNSLVDDHSRFTKGSRFIYVISNEFHPPAYLIGRVTQSVKQSLPVLENYSRHETLQDTEYAALASMIRTYSLGKQWESDDNELGLDRVDRYFPDLDISVGYDTMDRGLCVVIPEAPSLADA